jgi:hypothetical protein
MKHPLHILVALPALLALLGLCPASAQQMGASRLGGKMKVDRLNTRLHNEKLALADLERVPDKVTTVAPAPTGAADETRRERAYRENQEKKKKIVASAP